MKKIFEGTFALEHSRVTLQPMFARLAEIVGPAARGKRLSFRAESSVLRPVLTDERRLMQVLINLAANAVKFTREGGVSVVAREDAENIVISVQDTGIGIKRSEQRRIFEMFGTVDEKSERCETGILLRPILELGIGMGMYLARYIVTQMGGRIALASELGRGTTVTICIPAGMDEEAAEEEEDMDEGVKDMHVPGMRAEFGQQRPSRSVSSRSITKPSNIHLMPTHMRHTTEEAKNPALAPQILVVEDDPLVLLALKNMVEKLGRAVDVADNGETAVAMVRDKNSPTNCGGRYALVLMDANMPVMNGYVAAGRIGALARQGEIREVPVVCVSAQDSPEHQDMCRAAGMAEYGEDWARVIPRCS